MKNWIAVIMLAVVAIVCLFGGNAEEELLTKFDVVECHYGSEVCTMLEDWMDSIPDDYSNYKEHKIEEGVEYCYGVIDEAGFQREYELELGYETIKRVYEDHFGSGVEVEIKTVGMYEDWDVYELHIKSDTPIEDYEGQELYEGRLVFMVWRED